MNLTRQVEADLPKIPIITHIISAQKVGEGDMLMTMRTGLCEVHPFNLFSNIVPELLKVKNNDIIVSGRIINLEIEDGHGS